VCAPWRWVAAIYFVVLTVLTHWPAQVDAGPAHTAPDKLTHFLAFALLAVLVERARVLPRGWMAFVSVAVWAPLDEWTQHLVSDLRETSVADVIGGWLGVAAAAFSTAMLKPPHHAPPQAPWRRAIQAIDRMVASRAGLMAWGLAGTLAIITAPACYAAIWFGLDRSAPNLSLLLGITLGLSAAAPALLAAWRAVDGPRWPTPPPATWLLIPLGALAGQGLYLLLSWPSLRAACWLCGGIAGAAIAARLGWIATMGQRHV